MASAVGNAIGKGVKQVRPILSSDNAEARKRVLNLYKAWYRQIPLIGLYGLYDGPVYMICVVGCLVDGLFCCFFFSVMEYDIPKDEAQCRAKLREEFSKNKNVKDIRVIDMLVVKGQMELVETVQMWKQKGHLMTYFKPTVNPKPADFLSSFLSGGV